MAWADRSPLEQAALRYCAPLGIPLSVFLGRVVYPGSPQWTDDDTLAAFDWQGYQDRLCTGCGQSLDDTVGPDQFDKWNAEEVGACDACRALDRTARIKAGNDDLNPTAGVRFKVWRDKESA